MDINDRLFVQINPLERGQIPHPHPINEAKFDPAYVYKVLGMYNPSETSECYMVLANTQRQIWFIPQRHLLAYGVIDSEEMFLPIESAEAMKRSRRKVTLGPFPGEDREERPAAHNGHGLHNGGMVRSFP